MNFIYTSSVIGGTFDHFHLGHQKLINTAFNQSEHVLIGLTQPNMYQNKFLANLIEDYATRKKTLEKYLEEKNFLSRVEIIPIDDIYGTTLQDKNIEAIFATEENLHNVNTINTKRKEIDFPELKIIVVPYELDENQETINSEKIRKGEIDKNGFVYKNIFDKQQVVVLPDHLRPLLQKPLGDVVKTTADVVNLLDDKKIVIAVGDIIVSKLKEAGFDPAVSIIDFKTRRHDFTSQFLAENLSNKITNEKGTINRSAVDEIKTMINKYLETNHPQTIVIDGEEDLLALPAILLSPLQSIVLYGQHDMGIVVNIVNEESKEKIKEFVKRFE